MHGSLGMQVLKGCAALRTQPRSGARGPRRRARAGGPGPRLVAGRQLARRVGLPRGVARERGGHRRPPRGGGRQLVGDARQVARVARAQLPALRRPAPRERAHARQLLCCSVPLRTAPCSSIHFS